MKISKKISVALIVIIMALVAAYAVVQQGQRTDTVDSMSRDNVIQELSVFEYKKEMSEDQKKDYFDQFQITQQDLQNALDQVAKQGESSAALLYHPILILGSLHRDVGAYAKAELAYGYAHQLQPNAYPPLINLGELYFRYLNDYAQAEKYYLMSVEINGDHLDTSYYELSQLYRFFLKDEKRGEQILIDGVKKYPDNTSILALLALYYRETGQKEEALSRYREMLIKDPSSEVAKKAIEDLGQ